MILPLRWRVGSVTGLIHRYSEPFDVDDCIRKMMASTRWPRPGYLALGLLTRKP